jgi:predicted nuclease of restriction endonuclease-like (RecB) superfamily
LVEAVKDPAERLWYARQAIEHGWSRNILVHQIESGLYHRQGKAITNFERTLPAPQSELARELIKDPYSFDFLALGPDMSERELERSLLDPSDRSSSNWAKALRSSAANIRFRWVARTTTSICFSTICAYAVL